jgi:hypothetical protein
MESEGERAERTLFNGGLHVAGDHVLCTCGGKSCMIRLVCQKGVISSMPFHSALPPTREETTMGKDSLMIRQFMVGISAFK